LLGGAERAPAIVSATTMLGIGLGPGFHWPNILLGAFLGTAVHMLLRLMAKRDPQFFAVYLRHLTSPTTGIFRTRTRRRRASIVRWNHTSGIESWRYGRTVGRERRGGWGGRGLWRSRPTGAFCGADRPGR
jgi:type IV secretory pathway TrbD component